MSRKDTILISVLVNIGFLGVLFFLATTKNGERHEMTATTTTHPVHLISPPEPEVVAVAQEAPARDEIDQVLKHYTPPEPVEVTPLKSKTVEVIVKRGDSLDKIARLNNSSVKAIMQSNHLTSPRIDVGQVLVIPLGDVKPPQIEPMMKPLPTVEYYTMKSGDNPWKVAKQFKVRFDQLLDMNGLDEEKARNLRPGDTLRVK